MTNELATATDIVIFRLKRLWPFDPEKRPDIMAKCARCGVPFGQHHVKCSLSSCKEFMLDLHDLIESGEKTCEWRDASRYWSRRLTDCPSFVNMSIGPNARSAVPLKEHLRVKKAWIIFGFPKGNVPRFEVDLTDLTLYPATGQFKIDFTNVQEIADKEKKVT